MMTDNKNLEEGAGGGGVSSALFSLTLLLHNDKLLHTGQRGICRLNLGHV